MLKKQSPILLTLLGLFLVLGSIITVVIVDLPLVDRQPVTLTFDNAQTDRLAY